jgi:hypothetical protein
MLKKSLIALMLSGDVEKGLAQLKSVAEQGKS